MKIITVLFLLLVGIITNAQELTIKKKDSTVVDVRVVASSLKELTTSSKETIAYDEMANVTFQNYVPKRDDGLIIKLRQAGIKIIGNTGPALSVAKERVTRINPDALYPPYATTPQNSESPADISQVIKSLEQFRKQREGGLGLQIVGVLAIGATVAVNTIANQKNQDDIKSGAYFKTGYKVHEGMPSAVPIGGLVLGVIGLGISLDAGKHLKIGY